ncbi:MAG: hypothetical protein LBT40_15815 [Deltaproteobacteria bacterium]|jgi:TPR repeat protein|nr:hypothetical protein [Deltaproteobacteria bacterium]
MGLWDSIKKAAKETADIVKEVAKETVDDVKKTAKETVDDAKNFAEKLSDKETALDALKAAGKSAAKMGVTIAEMAVEAAADDANKKLGMADDEDEKARRAKAREEGRSVFDEEYDAYQERKRARRQPVKFGAFGAARKLIDGKKLSDIRDRAENKDLDAICELADECMSGRKVLLNEGKAVRLYEEAAGMGSARAMVSLADIYKGGRKGVDMDREKYGEWLWKAACVGTSEAGTTLSEYLFGKVGPEAADRELTEEETARISDMFSRFKMGDLLGGDSLAAMSIRLEMGDRLFGDSLAEMAECLIYGIGVAKHMGRAAVILEKACAYSDRAKFVYARMLIHGPDHLQDVERGMELMRDASLGSPEYRDCYFMHLMGRGDSDTKAEATWWQEMASEGDVGAKALYGRMLLQGTCVSPDPERGAAMLKEAAETEPDAAVDYGMLLIDGKIVDRDEKAGLEMIRSAADRLDRARCIYGQRLIRGDGVEKDAQAGLAYIRDAAESMDQGWAKYVYGRALFLGDGVAEDKLEGARWLRMGSRTSDSARYLYGKFLMEGETAEKDEQAGAACLRLAAWNYPPAMLMIGERLLDGKGVQQDEEVGTELIGKAAETMDEARVLYARLLLAGTGVPKDEKAAAALVRDASETSDEAKFFYGQLLLEGLGVEKDEGSGVAMVREAAENLDEARLRYGELLLEGRGVEKDEEAGVAMVREAAENGLPEAVKKLAELGPAGSPEGSDG